MKDNMERAPFLDLLPGLHGTNYSQRFVKAPSEAPYPCNYAAEAVDPNAAAIKATIGKLK